MNDSATIFKTILLIAVLCHGLPLAAQNGQGFSFIVIGDTRPMFGSSSYENFSQQIGRINAFNPSLIINLGDLIYGYMGPTRPDIWNQYRTIVSGLKTPYYQLPGNHDIFSRKAEHLYDSLFHKRYYSFDHKGAHFILIDNSEQAIWGNISDEQLAWIKTDLAGHADAPSFVFMHLPMWLPGKIDEKYYRLWKKTLHPLFSEHRVKAVFAGHIHSYGPTRYFDDIPYYITGGGGAELTRWYEENGGTFHFVFCTLQDNGTLSHSIVTDTAVLSEEQADVSNTRFFSQNNATDPTLDFTTIHRHGRGDVDFLLANPFNDTVSGSLRWQSLMPSVHINPSHYAVTLGPGRRTRFHFSFRFDHGVLPPDSLPLLDCSLKTTSVSLKFKKRLIIKRRLDIRQPATTITIDGSLNEWKGIPAIILKDDKMRECVRFKTCWNAGNLFVAAEVADSSVLNDQSGSMLFLNDALVLGIDRSHRQLPFENDDLQLEFSLDSATGVVRIYNRVAGRKVSADSSGIAATIKRKGCSKTLYEIALPERFLKPMALRKREKFGINFAICSSDSTRLWKFVSWLPGLEYEGIEGTFSSQLNFATAHLR